MLGSFLPTVDAVTQIAWVTFQWWAGVSIVTSLFVVLVSRPWKE